MMSLRDRQKVWRYDHSFRHSTGIGLTDRFTITISRTLADARQWRHCEFFDRSILHAKLCEQLVSIAPYKICRKLWGSTRKKIPSLRARVCAPNFKSVYVSMLAAFPRWMAILKRWNRTRVDRGSPVATVMWRPMSRENIAASSAKASNAYRRRKGWQLRGTKSGYRELENRRPTRCP